MSGRGDWPGGGGGGAACAVRVCISVCVYVSASVCESVCESRFYFALFQCSIESSFINAVFRTEREAD